MRTNKKNYIQAIVISIIGTVLIAFSAIFAHTHSATVFKNAGELAERMVQHDLFVPVSIIIAVAWGLVALWAQIKK